jgi:hypothetical protein
MKARKRYHESESTHKIRTKLNNSQLPKGMQHAKQKSRYQISSKPKYTSETSRKRYRSKQER